MITDPTNQEIFAKRKDPSKVPAALRQYISIHDASKPMGGLRHTNAIQEANAMLSEIADPPVAVPPVCP
jgi:hypothetical protein